MSSLTTPNGSTRIESESAATEPGSLEQRLATERGPQFWRALEELADSDDFASQLAASFPRLADAAQLDRRQFLKFLGASLALAGVAGCSSPPAHEIVPWVQAPHGLDGGLPQFYASALESAGYAVGVLVESHMGRPTKIEGNPNHPVNRGSTDARMQAAVLQVWDPDRSQAPLRGGIATSWNSFELHAARLAERFGAGGEGLRILSGRIISPTLAAQREDLLRRFPGAQWHQYEAIDNAQTLAGARLAFGRPLLPRYRFDRADVVLALDADFLGSMPGHLAYARDYADRRRGVERGEMNRLYAAEPTPSLTGAAADHAWPLDNDGVAVFVARLADALGIAGIAPIRGAAITPAMRRRVRAVAANLRAHAGRGLVLAGATQPAAVHALAHVLNEALGNAGRTVEYIEPFGPTDDDPPGALAGLVEAMRAGQVETLLVLGANPVYDTFADFDFATALKNVPDTIHLGLYVNETARACDWHLPQAHALESWSDARAIDGTVSLVQPLLEPLYAGRSAHEVIAMLLGAGPRIGREIVRGYWRGRLSGEFERTWSESLRVGVVADTATPATVGVRADARAVTGALAQWPVAASRDDDLELLFRPDPSVWDGRYANSGWLQELPRPLTQLTWGNAALIAPALAARHGLANGDVIELTLAGRHVRAPVWIMPGQAARSVTVHLGYGRRHAGRVGDGIGFDAYALRRSDAPWSANGLTIRRTGEHVDLAATQHHSRMEGREPVRRFTLAMLLANAGQPVLAEQDEPPPSLYPPREPEGYSWGMHVDLNTCIGCKACTIACQAENNIPVVGPEQVRAGREMHWIRVDRYYEGAPEAPLTYHQPVPCMHCEHAPCELVCPVGATLHDSEGLNLQVYNRCVGTRFCSNNCPYKVRRFNFLQYADLTTESLKGQRNPDVTVRNRGVMEKCTYCVQRIETAHIQASKDDRPIADGEIVTACQAVCPTHAITFGDINDPGSAVSRAKASKLDYALLGELNTRPHTTYGARVRNPNPALDDET